MRLSETDKKIILLVQEDIPLHPRPFREMARKVNMTEEAFIAHIKDLHRRGYIRRFGAHVRHRNAGIDHNAMIMWAVPEKNVERVGKSLAEIPEVTHCYQRPPFTEKGYNIFTMIHGRSKEDLHKLAELIAVRTGLDTYQMLFSTEEFKKASMKFFQKRNIMHDD
ncbi:MAG: Lrp/AsnC family transcriptional regulator [Deltaproteobacteria bacterium]|nr:Lrp/AsnC family transcriptional regulator [Deltaproteobacteria bacterium]